MVIIVAVAAGLLPSPAEAMRCGRDLISEGDPAYKVREACGPPDYVKPLYRYADPDSDYGDEIWYYNFGPNELVRELRFRDGRLARIRTADRGFREPGPGASCRPLDIDPGMTVYELRARCGEPVQRQVKRVLRPLRRDGRVYGHQRVWREDWYYDFGSQYIDRRVRLVNGRVESVDTVD